jgi:mono/diheme cytochrome c family protein
MRTFLIAASLLLACHSGDDRTREGRTSDVASAPKGAGAAVQLEPADVTQANASEYAKQPAEMDWSGGDAQAGAPLYMQSCWVCHGVRGQGGGPAAEHLNPKPRDFRDARFYIDADGNGRTGEPVDLARVILVGAEAFGGSELMQPWHETFTQEQVRDLVAYVLELGAES